MKNTKGWVISLTGSLFFFYAFIQVNMMTPLNGELLKEFQVNSSTISFLSAWYFYANIIFIIPAGLMLDRYSVRMLMMIGIAISVIGLVIFGFSNTLALASFGRFLTGIMMAFGLIGCLKLASIWLPAIHMALASSLIITIGMLGGIIAQVPVAVMVNKFGWRNAVFVLAALGVFIAIILFFIIKEPSIKKKEKGENVFYSLMHVIKNKENWYCGIFTCFVNLPLAILGALFGSTYLMQARNFSYIESPIIVSMLFIGMIFGSPFFGWFSDYIKKRKVPMYLGSISCFIFVLLMLYLPNVSFLWMFLLFFLIGFTSASQVLGYPVITESNPAETTGTALSLAAFIIMGIGYGLGIPFVGKLLDKMWVSTMVGGIPFYQIQTYQKAFLIIPIGILIGIIMVFLMKETKCKSISKDF